MVWKGKKKVVSTEIPHKKEIKKMVDAEIRKLEPAAELKVAAFNTAVTVIGNNTGSAFTANIPDATKLQQGTGRNQRVSDEIRIRRVRFAWGSVIPNGSADDTYRVVLFRDKQTQGTIFNIQDVFETTGAGITINSAFNIESKPTRFQILVDKLYRHKLAFTAASGTIDTDPQQHVIDHHFKIPVPLRFIDNTVAQTIAAIEYGSIYCFFVSKTGTVRVDNMSANMYYTDA